MRLCFPILSLFAGGNPKAFEQWLREKPVMIFEYLSKAGPLGVNGKPMFLRSCGMLNQDEFKRFRAYVDRVKEVLASV